MEAEILKKSRFDLQHLPRKALRYMFISEHRHQWPIGVMCRVFSVNPSGYYAWVRRPAAEPSAEEHALLLVIREIHAASNHTAGSRRTVHELALKHVRAGRHKVRRMMREDGTRAKRTPRRRGVQTTDSNHTLPVAENLLDRNFTATAPNEKWSCDITYIRTRRGFVVSGHRDGSVLTPGHRLARERKHRRAAKDHGALDGVEASQDGDRDDHSQRSRFTVCLKSIPRVHHERLQG